MPNKMERFTERARRVLSLAQEEAERFQHHAIGTEHLLLGLIREEEGIARHILSDMKVDYWQLSNLVSELSQMPPRSADKALDLSVDTKHVLERAVVEARRKNHNYIGTEHLLLALIQQPDAITTRILDRLQITPDAIRQGVERLLSHQGLRTVSRSLSSRMRSGFMRMMPGAAPFNPPTNVEAMKILQLIEDGKVTPEQGESLLKALPATSFPTPEGWVQVAKVERERETRTVRVVISDKRTNSVVTGFNLPVQRVHEGLNQLLGAIEAGTAHYLQYLDSDDDAYRIDVYMDEPDEATGAEAS
ncbi:MAG: hypothetical protein K8I30_11645 [Anaerolineae bacterium]|nr:hypothetical protein [Anaerolineae bacterium]